MCVRSGLLVLLVALGAMGMHGATTVDLLAAAGFFDLPVPGGSETLDALRIPADERALTLTFLARTLYGQGNGAETAAQARAALAAAQPAALGGTLRPPAGSDAVVPAPFSDAFWRELLKLPRSADLFSALVASRAALLMAAGATATNRSIRRLLEDDRELAAWILKQAPGAFVVVARSLRLDRQHIAVPGGPDAVGLWEALADASSARPKEFVRALLARDSGRLAWFFDTVAALPPERRAWALGGEASSEPADQAREMYASFRDTDARWRLEDHPFQRSGADPQSVIMLVDLHEGRLTGPSWQWLWNELFSRGSIRARDVRSIVSADRSIARPSWLVRQINASTFRERRARFEMLRLAQRVFREATLDVAPDLLVALSHYRRFPALFLTLERVDVRAPQTWAALADAARRADQGSGQDRRAALATFQGAVALVERARLVRALDAARADHVLRALAEAVSADRPVPTSVAAWIVDSLVPALPPLEIPDAWTGKTAYESTILQALAGQPGRDVVNVTWEGLEHTVDLAATERERLRRLRGMVPSPGLDAALASRRGDHLSAALIALVYTPALGDPDGSVLLSPDVVTRHDFGDAAVSAEQRELGPWRSPRDMLGIEGPWRAEGSLLGLDIALARLVMRRVADQEMPRAPTINFNDWQLLARSVAALNPYDLTDADRDELAAAIGRGRDRVLRAGNDLPDLMALAREARLSPTTRELLPWVVARQPESIHHVFALRDLLWLGQPSLSGDRLDQWGVPAEPLDGRLIPAMPRPAPWEDHAGHADDGRIATQVPDLTLRLVEETARRRLPARLLPALLSFAVQDFAHDVEARFADDWPAMVRAARSLPSARVEDYVAALAGTGHLR